MNYLYSKKMDLGHYKPGNDHHLADRISLELKTVKPFLYYKGMQLQIGRPCIAPRKIWALSVAEFMDYRILVTPDGLDMIQEVAAIETL